MTDLKQLTQPSDQAGKSAYEQLSRIRRPAPAQGGRRESGWPLTGPAETQQACRAIRVPIWIKAVIAILSTLAAPHMQRI